MSGNGAHRVGAAEWAKFWLRDGVEHLHARYVTHAFAPHTHEGYVIASVRAGVEAFRYRGATHRARLGFVAFINPGEVHTGYAETVGGWRYRTLYPSVENLRQTTQQVFGVAAEPYFPQAVVFDPDLAMRVRRYHLLSERGAGRGEREAAFLELISCAVSRHADGLFRLPEPRREPAAVQQVKDYLGTHLCEDVTLANLGALTGLSSYALLRAFRRHTGLTPHTYQLQRRLEAAKERLLLGETIASVATETGFFDQSHLGRHFKRVVGVTPGAFVKGAISSYEMCRRRAVG